MSPEQAQPAPIPSIGAVNAAYADIVAHNRKYASMGGSMINTLRAFMESSEPIDYTDPDAPEPTEDPEKFDEHMERAVTEGDMRGELQGILHEDILMRIGVKVAPSGSHMANALGERSTSTPLVARIANTELYKDFLGTLKPEDVENSKDQHFLQALLDGLQAKVSRPVDSAEQEDAMRTFIAIVPEYERLGLDAKTLRAKFPEKPAGTGYAWLSEDATQEQKAEQAAHDAYNQADQAAHTFEVMEEYVIYWGRNILPEFITAKNGQYLTPPEKQGFGPARWQYDGGQPNWGPALEFVAKLAQDGRTRDFAEEVRKALVSSLDEAIRKIDGGEEQDYVVSQRADLVNIKNALAGQAYDTDRLAEYTGEDQ